MKRFSWLILLMVFSVLPVYSAPARGPGASFWGISSYLTKLERYNATGSQDSRAQLALLTTQAGATWTQEELSWALIEPSNNGFNPVYDASLLEISQANLNIIGMLITTPAWARDSQCSGNYFCPPANVAEFGEWAGWMAERYDGDGLNDAPGSPRIAAWQIWNEANFPEQLPLNDEGQRRIRYGNMLVSAYNAIKAADPTAIVIAGGVYIYDGSAGLSFLNPTNGVFGLVPQAKQSFDVLGIHPYMPTIAPDSPTTPAIITFEGRIRNTLGWLAQIGRADAGLWITEVGWCTTGSAACPVVSEAQQAQYLIRSMVSAQHLGVGHVSWFQLEDAFDGEIVHPWAGAAILGNFTGSTYPQKPAYLAYKTMATTIASAAPAGTGPIHTFVYPASTPYNPLGEGTYDYRYLSGSKIIDVIWLPRSSATVNFPITPGKEVTILNRNGQTVSLPIQNNSVQVIISEDPIFIIQTDPIPDPVLVVSPNPLAMLARPNQISQATLSIKEQHGQTISWSASDDAPWLTLSAASGTTPATLIATAQAPANPGLSTATITINAGAAGTQVITVQLRVSNTIYTIPLPVVRK